MPPQIDWALGIVGAAAAVKWLSAEARRVNATLDATRRAERDAQGPGPEPAEARPTLRRDPRTGVYRPQ